MSAIALHLVDSIGMYHIPVATGFCDEMRDVHRRQLCGAHFKDKRVNLLAYLAFYSKRRTLRLSHESGVSRRHKVSQRDTTIRSLEMVRPKAFKVSHQLRVASNSSLI
ncbi:uncharacterized protein BcabD6B2_34250 [Babesia caballi]|uniref:Uncharacterized protein n=1 Tax=Babesia caballi TaxID=5871 RepID=A0AAV4LWK1_BABCB|nr:hypothetical protein BcabD6B2_34250 [Babesia caballi]